MQADASPIHVDAQPAFRPSDCRLGTVTPLPLGCSPGHYELEQLINTTTTTTTTAMMGILEWPWVMDP